MSHCSLEPEGFYRLYETAWISILAALARHSQFGASTERNEHITATNYCDNQWRRHHSRHLFQRLSQKHYPGWLEPRGTAAMLAELLSTWKSHHTAAEMSCGSVIPREYRESFKVRHHRRCHWHIRFTGQVEGELELQQYDDFNDGYY